MAQAILTQVMAALVAGTFDAVLNLLPMLRPLTECREGDGYGHRGETTWEHTLEVIARLMSDAGLSGDRLNIALIAALFHDAGKPAVRTVDEDGRVRFFKHAAESVGVFDAVEGLAAAMDEMLGAGSAALCRQLIALHDDPLSISRNEGGHNAVGRIVRQFDNADDAELLFLFAQCDSPDNDIVSLYTDYAHQAEAEAKAKARKKEISTAINALGIAPGPIFGKITQAVMGRGGDVDALVREEAEKLGAL
jgi:hypothetical protein